MLGAGNMGRFTDKLVDVTAIRPRGFWGRLLYRNPRSHYRWFRIAREKLCLQPDDLFLEVGCGGGVLLKQALETVKQASAIDHSPDMVQLARQANAEAVAEGSAEIVEGTGESLRWPDSTFTCAASVGAFCYMGEPMSALRELHRVLKPGGRLVIATAAPIKSKLVRLVAAPWVSAMRCYADEEMREMLSEAGFARVEVETLDRYCQFCYGEKPG